MEFKPGKSRETATSQWQCLRTHGHQGSPPPPAWCKRKGCSRIEHALQDEKGVRVMLEHQQWLRSRSLKWTPYSLEREKTGSLSNRVVRGSIIRVSGEGHSRYY